MRQWRAARAALPVNVTCVVRGAWYRGNPHAPRTTHHARGSMKIYTKTGDAGETGLFGGGRVLKDDPRVRAYGDVDELNAALGFAAALEPRDFELGALQTIQRDLFTIGAELATPDARKLGKVLARSGA